jgi:serine protease Do
MARPLSIRILAAGALTLLLALAALDAAAADPFLRRSAAVRAVESAGPAVVNITTETEVQRRPFSGFRGDPFFDRFFRDFFEPGQSHTNQSLGSGVIIDSKGHVLTNEHVIGRASRIYVTLADGRDYDASLVGADPNNDLAVLRIEGGGALPWVEPGTSEGLMVGEPVIAIGNPFGLSNTVTTGVVSALDRSIRAEDRAFYGFIQTDASINPGNSGGPLLNAEGSLIGINTAIYQRAQGIGFAIPIDVAKRVVEELIEHGAVAPVWLGVELQDLDPDLGEAMDLPRGTRGALIAGVVPKTPAAKAGLRRGDVIRRVNGREVQTARAFYAMLERATPDEDLHLSLLRGAKTLEIKTHTQEIAPEAIDRMVEKLLGLGLVPQEGGGFQVREVVAQSGAAQVGFRSGDHLLRINGQQVRDRAALRRAVLGLRGRDRALIGVRRGNGRYHVTVPLS